MGYTYPRDAVKQPRIKKNAARCKRCQDVIESKHVHDFVTCTCGAISVDGGKCYLRRVGQIFNMEDLSEYEDLPAEEGN